MNEFEAPGEGPRVRGWGGVPLIKRGGTINKALGVQTSVRVFRHGGGGPGILSSEKMTFARTERNRAREKTRESERGVTGRIPPESARKGIGTLNGAPQPGKPDPRRRAPFTSAWQGPTAPLNAA